MTLKEMLRVTRDTGAARWRGCSARCQEKPSVKVLEESAHLLWRKSLKGELRTEPSVLEGRNNSLQAGLGGLEELRVRTQVWRTVSRDEIRKGDSVELAQRHPEAPG